MRVIVVVPLFLFASLGAHADMTTARWRENLNSRQKHYQVIVLKDGTRVTATGNRRGNYIEVRYRGTTRWINDPGVAPIRASEAPRTRTAPIPKPATISLDGQIASLLRDVRTAKSTGTPPTTCLTTASASGASSRSMAAPAPATESSASDERPLHFQMGDFRDKITHYGIKGQANGGRGRGSLEDADMLPALARFPHGISKFSMDALTPTPSQSDIDEIKEMGYVPLVRNLRMYYGTWQTVDAIMTVAANVAQRFHKFPDKLAHPLLVGEMTKEHGGQGNDHRSHQNGQDADLIYYELGKPHGGDEVGMKSFTSSTTKNGVHPNFDMERNWALLEELAILNKTAREAKQPRIVSDIFIEPVLASALLAHGQGKPLYSEVAKVVRPRTKHHQHMHVRFEIPFSGEIEDSPASRETKSNTPTKKKSRGSSSRKPRR